MSKVMKQLVEMKQIKQIQRQMLKNQLLKNRLSKNQLDLASTGTLWKCSKMINVRIRSQKMISISTGTKGFQKLLVSKNAQMLKLMELNSPLQQNAEQMKFSSKYLRTTNVKLITIAFSDTNFLSIGKTLDVPRSVTQF